MSSADGIRVTSHVARDFLQNADYFSTMPKVVWEYVSNALDNPKEGRPVRVDVGISAGRVVVTDNASGMDREDLLRFFQMHGHNVQRQRGRIVRGRFGTGKSAALGIARTLRIETRKNHHFNIVELRREAIESASDGEPFAVKEVLSDAPTDEEDGTTVIISRLHDPKRLEIDETRRYVERHLGSHQVFINGHQCEFQGPVAIQTYELDAPVRVRERIGPVTPDGEGLPVSSGRGDQRHRRPRSRAVARHDFRRPSAPGLGPSPLRRSLLRPAGNLGR